MTIKKSYRGRLPSFIIPHSCYDWISLSCSLDLGNERSFSEEMKYPCVFNITYVLKTEKLDSHHFSHFLVFLGKIETNSDKKCTRISVPVICTLESTVCVMLYW